MSTLAPAAVAFAASLLTFFSGFGLGTALVAALLAALGILVAAGVI